MYISRKKRKNKWFKQYKKEIINVEKELFNESLSRLLKYDSNVKMHCISFYDIVNNNDVNKIVKKICYLKRDKQYKIDLLYRKKLIRNINYIMPEFDSTGYGKFADIEYLNDEMIKSVEMTWSQINNEQALIEYKIYLKKPIGCFDTIHNYILNNYNKLKKIKYSVFYYNLDFFCKDKSHLFEIEVNYFRTLLQFKLKNILSSSYSSKYLLPVKYLYLVEKKSKKIVDQIKKMDLCESYIINNNHYLIVDNCENNEGMEIDEIFFGNIYNPVHVVSLISYYRMALYYTLFYNIEKTEMELRIGKYLNSNKMFINIFDYKWLISKKRRISEKRFYNVNQIKSEIKNFSNKKTNFIDESIIENITHVYDEYIEYMKNINMMNYNIAVFILSILSIIIAFSALLFK